MSDGQRFSREREERAPTSSAAAGSDFDVVVLGGGSGGYATALRAAQLNLALDVDHPAGAEAGARCNAGRPTEAMGAELQHRKSIDLTDHRAGGIDQHDVAADGFL